MKPLLRLEAVSLSYGDHPVFEGVALELPEGDCRVLVGPNGAGKTTMLRLATGLLSPTRGRVLWRERPIDDLSGRERARRIAYVPQIRPSRMPFTVEELLLQGRYPHRERLRLGPSLRDLEAVEQVLETTGLHPLRRRRLDQLSGGERQVAFIGAALAQEAPLLVLDEPTTHLDPSHRREVARLLKRLHHHSRQTVLLATHDLHLAAHLGESVTALSAGRLLATGPVAEVLSPSRLESLFDTPFHHPEIEGRAVPLAELE